ncbi:NAD(P)-binding protein [Penicillium longicatenatum]|uniref:NAD(P)-binding protein n=1 Tax=Penicillium longicatenatum TaxID=1561947 RepID=UPI002548EF76|nr:NAD(P)-binding protein [Penicillium longicatenatum]KAJ5651449.1 NAD(P)-binding protein [Penicillium longicatenatum]
MDIAFIRPAQVITGVTGYIGFKTLTVAIKEKYRVRAVVRREQDILGLQRKSPIITSALGQGRLEFALVPDLLSKDAVFNVLDGITAVIHLASPLAVESNDYESSIIKPTISMVTTILEAARRVKTIRRVILTSSCVTLIPFEWNMSPDNERLYTGKDRSPEHTCKHILISTIENDLNDKVTGPFSSAMEAYWAAKALARMATKSFISQGKAQFDIVNLLPSVVIGPDDRLLYDDTATRGNLLEGTRGAVLAPALSSSLNSPFDYVGVPVHVADVARAHVDAVDDALVPGNSEYILCSNTPEGVVWDQEIKRIARQYFPTDVENKTLPLEGSLGTVKWRLDALWSEKVFGWQFTSFEETMRGLIEQYLQLRPE